MTMRDADRFKDKIEVSLDGRQIFFLFFGGAVVACMVFVLGVMVGRRLEGRERVARKATTSASIDPLAALDELAADEQRVPEPAAPRPAAPPPAPAVEKKPEPPKVEPPKPEPPRPEVKEEKKEKKKAEKEDVESKKKPKYTLQLSSFQDRAEADAFVTKLAGAGYQPYVVQREVEGRGTFYRVRIGEFVSHDDALEAKAEFERRQHIIAYVTKL
jgi:cell division septation protein DedD